MFALSLIAAALAVGPGPDGPEVAVVGLHVPGRAGDVAAEDAARLVEALEGTGKVDALEPMAVSRRIAGRETIVLDNYALGPGRERLKEGKVLYDRAQPDQAIPVLQQAAKQLSAGLAVSTDARDLHDALILLGMAHVGMGDEAAAKAAFRRSAILDPGRQLDPVNYPPQVRQVFDQVRAEVAKAPPARLSVTAPAEATVWVDGRRVGSGSQADVPLVAGEHFVLVRAADGASRFEALTLESGAKRAVDAATLSRGLGVPAADAAGRSRQTRDLYRALGEQTDRAVVALGGVTATGQVALQLYSPSSGNFSRAVTGDAGGDPVGAMVDLAPALVAYLDEQGEVRTDRVSPQIVSLDVSTNELLAGMLLDPPKVEPQVVEVSRGPKWWVWAGLGAVAAAGGGAVAYVALADDGETGGTTVVNEATVVFGPIP